MDTTGVVSDTFLVSQKYLSPLFSWRTNPSNGGPGARDYERGGLFFTYIAEQQGHEIVGEMMRDTEKKVPLGWIRY